MFLEPLITYSSIQAQAHAFKETLQFKHFYQTVQCRLWLLLSYRTLRKSAELRNPDTVLQTTLIKYFSETDAVRVGFNYQTDKNWEFTSYISNPELISSWDTQSVSASLVSCFIDWIRALSLVGLWRIPEKNCTFSRAAPVPSKWSK